MVGKLTIDSMDDFEESTEVGIELNIVPQQAAQKVADRITKAGITGILNFTLSNVPRRFEYII